MRKPLWFCGLSLLSLCFLTEASEADVFVRGPFGGTWVAVTPPQTGPGVLVQAPGVQVQLQQPPPPSPIVVVPQTPPPPPGPIVVVPQPPLPPPSVVVPLKPLTHREFAKIFRPIPGNYQVVLIHPGSGAPVNVSFTLPPGNPRVRVHPRELVFDYGRHEVEIRFAIHGKVKVITR